MTLEATTHKNILVHILKDIYDDKKIGPVLGFKGGTAAYFFYGLERFSTDLDFDLLDNNKEELVYETINDILARYGTIKESRRKRYTIFFVLSYENKIYNAYNIKVEINLRNFGSRYETKSYLGLPMQVMVQEDMAAHKMVAMIERLGKTNRDIFDVWFFLKKNWPINEKIILQRTGLSARDFLQQCIVRLEKHSNTGILSGIGELLDEKQKAWAKEKLLSETIFLLALRKQSIVD